MQRGFSHKHKGICLHRKTSYFRETQLSVVEHHTHHHLWCVYGSHLSGNKKYVFVTSLCYKKYISRSRSDDAGGGGGEGNKGEGDTDNVINR